MPLTGYAYVTCSGKQAGCQPAFKSLIFFCFFPFGVIILKKLTELGEREEKGMGTIKEQEDWKRRQKEEEKERGKIVEGREGTGKLRKEKRIAQCIFGIICNHSIYMCP